TAAGGGAPGTPGAPQRSPTKDVCRRAGNRRRGGAARRNRSGRSPPPRDRNPRPSRAARGAHVYERAGSPHSGASRTKEGRERGSGVKPAVLRLRQRVSARQSQDGLDIPDARGRVHSTSRQSKANTIKARRESSPGRAYAVTPTQREEPHDSFLVLPQAKRSARGEQREEPFE